MRGDGRRAGARRSDSGAAQRRIARTARALLALTLPFASASCAAKPAPMTADGKLRVVASFYPLAFAAAQIGGDAVTVTDLTKPGVEPHDLELSPKAVASVASAGLVLYLDGFQPAVDTAVAAEAPTTALDVTSVADLEVHDDEETDGHDEHNHGESADPHFWLDPQRYRAVSATIADRLAARLPDQAPAIRARATTFLDEIDRLDTEFTTGLAQCTSHELVTGHAAFGYLAERYGLHEVSVSGLNPDSEPEPTALARIARYVADHDVQTIYTETLAEPQVARAVAAETGAQVATLDPIEAVSETSSGADYFAISRHNLATLRTGQECS